MTECTALTWAILKADRKPDWIWPRCTTPVTPTTSSIPSQWLGFENWSSFSGPQGLAPEPQLQMCQVSLTASISHKLLWKQGCFASTRNPQRLLNTKVHYQLCKYVPASTLPQPVQSSSHIYTTNFSKLCFIITLPEKYPHKLLCVSCTNQNVWTSCFHYAPHLILHALNL